ncbi:RICIN domain-containing protein [Hymenobacter sp. HSC-4F20]|uniref:RICIN domain-containing protein n=1 Tax=Hymenobacter sp. HSC-4F20 TaxID=2864135 RepID=UPI001C73BAF3|nr:RICIN domain-containing protein [Hymenobacter sp. HSC-4F20]MBX0289260.1 RICIN domain-containing protein [Hymenobacter sp. HSC-4F20]
MKNLFPHRPGPIRASLAVLSLLALHSGAVQAQSVSLWMTTGDQTKLLQPQANVSFGANTGTASTTITVNEGTTYQTIDGFGASMTGSSAYVLNQKMSATQRDALLNDLFTGSGIRLSFLRHTMGASDFSAQGDFTYDDKPQGQTDPNLTSFSIQPDRQDVIPMLKAARAKNGNLKLMGSPWSAPAWMKETYKLRGGWLSTTWYQAYANYFVKYVQAYAAEGLPIYAVTLQNEPLYEAPYMAMRMDPGNQAAFLKNNIGPAFRNAGITTKLIVYDHNWDRPDYPNAVFADAAAAQYAAGSAFHGYGGNVSQQSTTHDAYPGKDIWFTEVSGTAGSSFAGDLKWHLSNIIIGTTRNWAKSALEWNLALDQNNGPTNGGCTTCRGVVTVNNTTGSVTRNVEYYALGHASKFVDPGAVRIASNSVAGGIENVAFRNPDGSKVLIALNNGSAASTFKVVWNNQAFTYTLPAGAVATYKWTGGTSTASGPQIGRTYEISSKNGGKALDIDGNSTTNGGRLQQWTWGGTANQKWKLVDAGGGYVRIVNQNSNKSLDIVGPSTTNGALIHQWDWASADNQYWQIVANGDGTYRIINKYSGKVLDVQNNSTADGASIQQWDWSNSDNQKWWFSDQGAAARVALATAGSAADARLQVYPTVVNTELSLHYTAAARQQLTLRLLDLTGRVAISQTERAVTAGENELTVPVASLTAGVYLLQVDTPDGQLLRRVVIAH